MGKGCVSTTPDHFSHDRYNNETYVFFSNAGDVPNMILPAPSKKDVLGHGRHPLYIGFKEVFIARALQVPQNALEEPEPTGSGMGNGDLMGYEWGFHRDFIGISWNT